MRLLVDTHILFWWLVERDRLSPTALAAIGREDAEVLVSLASAWEMAIKIGAGKWTQATTVLNTFETLLAVEDFRLLPINLAHVRQAGLCNHCIAIRSTGCLLRRHRSRD